MQVEPLLLERRQSSSTKRGELDGLYDSHHRRGEHTYRTAGTCEAKVCVTDDSPGHDDIRQSHTVTVN